ncbi:hypothetical protein [Lichenicoccus sp.]|uniref:hypothetical protein n=1 Tax=Lichenicoccus sp. TaxID=2781899 RepID=UPI003D0BD815
MALPPVEFVEQEKPMQDEGKPEPLDEQTPPSHPETNRPGMTNGVPDEAHEGESMGLPHDDRTDVEKAAGEKKDRAP